MNALAQLLMRRNDQLKSIIHSAMIHEGGHNSEVQKHFNLIEQIKKDLADEEPLDLDRYACGHKWVHTDTRKPKLEASGNQYHYIRIDQFFCEKCLKTETVRRSEYAYDTPDWF